MKKIKAALTTALVLLLVGAIAFSYFYGMIRSVTSLSALSEVSTSAKAMCLIEASTGRVLASKNEQAPLAMASTTKIMTAITAIENAENLDEIFEIDPSAVGISGTSMYLRKGEKHSLRDLLYALMLVSANDASVAIGKRVGGTLEKFVDMMNFTAYKIGATSTHFENTHGLDEQGHYTSARDLALIAAYALNNPTFRDIVSTKNIKITSADGKTRYLHNKNKLLQSFDGAMGVKTGFTDDAGRCLVSAAERDGMRLVCVVLNCSPMFEDCAALMNWGFENFKMVDLCQGLTLPDSLPVENGERPSVGITKKGSCFFPLAEGEENLVKIETHLAQSVTPVLCEGEKVGDYQIYFDNSLRFSGEIVTIDAVKARTLAQRLQDILEKW